MELKTIQILDQLEISRPCIDARNVGYNVEWSQELRLDDSYTVASETCAFDLIDGEYIRDVVPGEILKIQDQHLESFFLPPAPQKAHCIFEHVYFARPDSKVFDRSVHLSRYQMGRRLAREAPVEADLVVPVPDSGVTAALGYADESGIPFQVGLIRNHYVGRTFIEPKQSIRHFDCATGK